MRTLIITFLFALPFTAACGDDSQCDKVADHFVDLAPEGIKSRLGDKSALAKKCEKDMSSDERSCVLAAESFEGIMDCKTKK